MDFFKRPQIAFSGSVNRRIRPFSYWQRVETDGFFNGVVAAAGTVRAGCGHWDCRNKFGNGARNGERGRSAAAIAAGGSSSEAVAARWRGAT
eukprot:801994-Pleurochrysis_carterae.AAC.1